MKRWKHKGKPFLIPDTHEPGKQNGFMTSGKGHKAGSSEHSSKFRGVGYWPVGRWALGDITRVVAAVKKK